MSMQRHYMEAPDDAADIGQAVLSLPLA
jgi:hypothetical protein